MTTYGLTDMQLALVQGVAAGADLLYWQDTGYVIRAEDASVTKVTCDIGAIITLGYITMAERTPGQPFWETKYRITPRGIVVAKGLDPGPQAPPPISEKGPRRSPRKGEEAPTITEEPGPGGTDPITVQRHPAYALIGASRVSGTTHLYGSDFAHRNYVTITVRRSERRRDPSRDWDCGREELIEVALSEAQWAAFVSAMNVGQGVPCTLERVAGVRVPDLPAPASRAEQFKGEFGAQLKKGREILMALKQKLAEGKGKRETVPLLDHALAELGGNLGFVADQFGEHMEHTVEAAKTEVNAYMLNAVQRAGLAALGATPPIALDARKEDD